MSTLGHLDIIGLSLRRNYLTTGTFRECGATLVVRAHLKVCRNSRSVIGLITVGEFCPVGQGSFTLAAAGGICWKFAESWAVFAAEAP